jgi:hypothetical protein
MGVIPAARDAFGRALEDHLSGRSGLILLLEADDGSSRPADLQPGDFFLPPDRWPAWERHLVARARGMCSTSVPARDDMRSTSRRKGST